MPSATDSRRRSTQPALRRAACAVALSLAALLATLGLVTRVSAREARDDVAPRALEPPRRAFSGAARSAARLTAAPKAPHKNKTRALAHGDPSARDFASDPETRATLPARSSSSPTVLQHRSVERSTGKLPAAYVRVTLPALALAGSLSVASASREARPGRALDRPVLSTREPGSNAPRDGPFRDAAQVSQVSGSATERPTS